MQPHGAVQDVRRRHFQDRPGGYINCLDSGGFGGVTITKSLSIVCEGVIADGARLKKWVLPRIAVTLY